MISNKAKIWRQISSAQVSTQPCPTSKNAYLLVPWTPLYLLIVRLYFFLIHPDQHRALFASWRCFRYSELLLVAENCHKYV